MTVPTGAAQPLHHLFDDLESMNLLLAFPRAGDVHLVHRVGLRVLLHRRGLSHSTVGGGRLETKALGHPLVLVVLRCLRLLVEAVVALQFDLFAALVETLVSHLKGRLLLLYFDAVLFPHWVPDSVCGRWVERL